MKIRDILFPEEIAAADARRVILPDEPLKSLTVADLKSLFPIITFKIHDAESDGHAAAHVLNELHLRTVSMDFYPDASLEQAIERRKAEKKRLINPNAF